MAEAYLFPGSEPAPRPDLATPPALEVEGLTVAYDGQPVLMGVDYRAPASGLIAIVGPNGAGKSSFIKAVLGLVPRQAGRVSILGQDADEARQSVAYVPQRSELDWEFPVSVLEVVTMALYRRIGWLRPVGRKHREQARAALAEVGMADFAERQIGRLSGGQQQRVLIARALAQDAKVYFMDEPFAGVDAASEATIVELMGQLDAEGKRVFCVHHDLETVAEHFDHALLLNRVKVAEGPVEDALTLETLRRAYGARVRAFSTVN